jgi:tripartite-type tricarboxylate transporter receptor subunit TctC
MIIAFPAGSGVDVIGRALAQAITQRTGQTVIVLNRDGAAGTLGFAALAAAAPDGHTLAFGPTTPIANAPYLVKGVRYGVESFTYICQVFENVFAIAVGPQSRFTSITDLLASAAASPGTLTYGHAGLGTIPHLSMENMAEALKYRFSAVPFRGDAPLVPALLRGEIDFAAVGISTIRPQPTIRPLAIFSDRRHPAYPDLPTVKELGVAVGVPPGHNGLFAPRGVSADVRNALESMCKAVIEESSVRRVMTITGQSIEYLNGADFAAQTAADYTAKGDLIRRLGLGMPDRP